MIGQGRCASERCKPEATSVGVSQVVSRESYDGNDQPKDEIVALGCEEASCENDEQHHGNHAVVKEWS